MTLSPHRTTPVPVPHALLFSRLIETLAAGLLLLSCAVHGWLMADAFHDAHYKGVLFSLNALLSLVCAWDLKRGSRVYGWLGGALICAGSVAAYVVSRTMGLLGLPAEPDAWFEPLGVLSLVAESLFLGLLAHHCVWNDEDSEDEA